MLHFYHEHIHRGCHCGAVRFEIEYTPEKGITCNCSRCSKLGWILAFVPATQFTLISGQDSLEDYRFNTKTIAHRFCKQCGIEPFAIGNDPTQGETVAINLRCLDEFELNTLSLETVDGKSI